jgi:hypothetical protein
VIPGVLHVLGIDNVSGEWYAFWSGFGGDLTIFGAVISLWRKHSCHQKWCWRIGRHPHGDWLLCSRHHPLGAPTSATIAQYGISAPTVARGGPVTAHPNGGEQL